MFTLIVLSIFALAAGANFTCDECKTLVTKSEDFLLLFDEYAMYECTQLQAHEVQACQEIVQTVIPYIATQIVERYTPETTCQKLEYCQRKWRFWV